MDKSATRFLQRKEHYLKALALLEKQTNRNDYEDENIAATLHFYETAFELAWKLLKDYLQLEGFIIKSPREAIKKAFQINIIADGTLWIEMLDTRNNISHIYDEKMARNLFDKVKSTHVNALKLLRDLQC